MTWLDLRVTQSKEITETYWRGQSRTDARGGYEICGVPTSTGLRIRVTSDSAAGRLLLTLRRTSGAEASTAQARYVLAESAPPADESPG